MGNSVEIYVGSRLRRTREFRGLKLRDLARRLGLAVRALQLLESGAARLAGPVLFAASKALGVDPSFFFKGRKGREDGAIALDVVEPNRAPGNDNDRQFRKPRSRPALAIVDAEAPREMGSPTD